MNIERELVDRIEFLVKDNHIRRDVIIVERYHKTTIEWVTNPSTRERIQRVTTAYDVSVSRESIVHATEKKRGKQEIGILNADMDMTAEASATLYDEYADYWQAKAL